MHLILLMNRITNKEYLIDITIKTLEAQQPLHPTKVKCEVHYADDSYLRIHLQPMLRNGVALFCDERLRIPFSSEISIVFKFIKPNKKESFEGHYLLEVEKLLSEKQYYVKIKDKLEESDAVVNFQCRIIDKQLLCESDTEQPELQANLHIPDKSIVTLAERIHTIMVEKPLSELNARDRIRKTNINLIPMPPEQYGKIVRQAQDILNKRQLFSQRHQIITNYSRDKYGMLRTAKITELQQRLSDCRRDRFYYNLTIYVGVSLIFFFVGMQM